MLACRVGIEGKSAQAASPHGRRGWRGENGCDKWQITLFRERPAIAGGGVLFEFHQKHIAEVRGDQRPVVCVGYKNGFQEISLSYKGIYATQDAIM